MVMTPMEASADEKQTGHQKALLYRAGLFDVLPKSALNSTHNWCNTVLHLHGHQHRVVNRTTCHPFQQLSEVKRCIHRARMHR